MIERFEGENGKKDLVEVLLQQEVVAHNRMFAEHLATTGSLTRFQTGETIIEQNAADTDAYFIINGEAEIFVNNRSVAIRGGGEVVGEMAAINPAVRRSATVKAKTQLTVLKIAAAELMKAADGSVAFWKHATRMTGDRLREREKFHRPANEVPLLFLGSSVEGLDLAKALESAFKHSEPIVRPWYNDGVFGPSKYTMDDLMKQVNECDFAMFVFGPDDKIHSRDADYDAPRDNVVLELGLFMGKLGRERVFMVKEARTPLKIPSDLTGVKPVEYVRKKGAAISDVVGSVRNDIEAIVKQLGAL